ncbi:hypothetical protein [Geodermatophilus sp. SYSU D00696]
MRELQERLRRGAQAVAATEGRIAATLLEMADRALRETRLEDAQRLLRQAAAAFRGAEHERLRAERWPAATAPDAEPAGAPRRPPAGDRVREDEARDRDRAARDRDDAAERRERDARRRDEEATGRDHRADLRGEEADRREVAAAEGRAGRASRAAPPGAGGEQRAVDAEVEASHRAWAEDDRAQAAADRAADAADRRAAEDDRAAAARDRAAARADRRRAAGDRAAARADRDGSPDAGPVDRS